MKHLLLGLIVLAACDDYTQCDEAPLAAELPQRLSKTGLEAGTPYTVQFELFADGAGKQRWILLPPGGVIDKSDPDFWQFPTGTKLWKQFTRDGRPVETRLLMKLDAGWAMQSYVWSGDDAVATPEGNAMLKVPSAAECRGCHGGTPSGVLGYSAVQLGEATLPGDATARAALGWLHANCGHCHNQSRPPRDGARCYDPQKGFELLLRAGTARVEDTGAFDAARKHNLPNVISRGFMPPLGRTEVDTTGRDAVQRWVDSVKP